jgi:hypothetical protein
MQLRYGALLLLSLCGVWLLPAPAQEGAAGKQLTARELFYIAAKPAAASKPPAAAPAAARKANRSTEVARTKQPDPAPAAPPARTTPPRGAEGAAIVAATQRKTAPAPSAGPPLGLRYSILKLTGNHMVEVAPDSAFRAGDRIQITVEPNTSGYLYIISQGSSGTWKPLFPSAEVEDGNNRVEGYRSYILPPRSRIVFDEQPGTEKLFIVLSREPENDLEQMIYSLQKPAGAKPADTRPAAPGNEPPRTMIAATIGDDLVGRLRTVYARDLVIEKVDESTPGDRKEHAVYVVNPSGSPNSRVVADLHLVHQ